MAQKGRARAEAEKARRQKVLLALLTPVFLILLVVQAPKLMKSPGVAGPEVVEAGTGNPVVQPVDEPTGTDPTSTPTPGSGGLAGEAFFSSSPGQLSDLDRFASRDPFGALPVGEAPSGGASSGGGSDGGSKGSSGGGGGSKGGNGGGSSDPFISAVISVNGARETVQLNGTFPAAAPVFVLKSIDGKSVEITVWGGQFSSGVKAIKLTKGQRLTLMNAVDGSRYVLLLISVSRQAGSGGEADPTSTTTAPVVTTSTTSEPPPPVPPTTTTS